MHSIPCGHQQKTHEMGKPRVGGFPFLGKIYANGGGGVVGGGTHSFIKYPSVTADCANLKNVKGKEFYLECWMV